eukprot:6205978-Pleurochrysis_carterae.AAC.1
MPDAQSPSVVSSNITRMHAESAAQRSGAKSSDFASILVWDRAATTYENQDGLAGRTCRRLLMTVAYASIRPT